MKPAPRVLRHSTELPTRAPQIGQLIDSAQAPRLAAAPSALAGLRADAGVAGGRWVAAASLVGQAHLSAGTSAQDAYCVATSRDGSALVLAVCDGLGAHPDTAQLGAELFARFGCARAADITAADAATHGVAALVDAVADANQDVLDYRATRLPDRRDDDLHCTVLLARLPLTPDGGDALLARAGDGEAFLLRAGEYDTVFPARADGPANLVRGPLPAAQPHALLEQARFRPDDADLLVLATDGVANDIFDSPGVREWLRERWAVPCGPVRMLDALRYRVTGSRDDRTAVAVWLSPWTDPDDEPEPEAATEPLRRYPLDEF